MNVKVNLYKEDYLAKEVALLAKGIRLDSTSIIMYLIILFLIAKFLGLTKAYNIDPFGVEPEFVWGVIAIAIGVLKRDIEKLNNKLDTMFLKLSELGERTAKLEARG